MRYSCPAKARVGRAYLHASLLGVNRVGAVDERVHCAVSPCSNKGNEDGERAQESGREAGKTVSVCVCKVEIMTEQLRTKL